MERKHYIDNLRWVCILLLIPYHAAMAYNSWGENNYIILGSSKILSSIVVAISPWYMPLLFLLAGISAKYSLAKRSYKQFTLERITKLLIPFLSCTLLFMPILSYITDKINYEYMGNFFEHYFVFFTKWTDLSGYDGGFGIGHLWFLLYLFVICFLASLLDVLFGKYIIKLKIDKTYSLLLVFLIILVMFMSNIKIGGKSIVTFLFIYLIGYYILSNDDVVERVIKFRYLYLFFWFISTILNVWLFIWSNYNLPIINTLLNFLSGGFGILSLISIGSNNFNCNNTFTKFLTSISFLIYIIHFIWVVVFEYIFSLLSNNIAFVFILSVLFSIIATIITCIGIKKCPVIKVFFGYKYKTIK